MRLRNMVCEVFVITHAIAPAARNAKAVKRFYLTVFDKPRPIKL